MAEDEGRFSKPRLEAFSDGVIAVIITIMALELKAPENDDLAALVKLWPSFAIYLVSFVFIAIYWINHHNLLNEARRVTASLIWANAALLFSLSLVPFATAYVGATRAAPLPTVLYGALQFVCGLAITLVLATIAAERADDAEFQRAMATRRVQNFAGLTVYALATVLAAWRPFGALALFAFVAIAFVTPNLLAEAAKRRARRKSG